MRETMKSICIQSGGMRLICSQQSYSNKPIDNTYPTAEKPNCDATSELNIDWLAIASGMQLNPFNITENCACLSFFYAAAGCKHRTIMAPTSQFVC